MRRLNEDLLRGAVKEAEAWERDHDFWLPPSRVFRFCVLSGLAPQIVEEPFVQMYFRILDKERANYLDLEPRGHTKTSRQKALFAFMACETDAHKWGPQVRLCYLRETASLAVRVSKSVRQAVSTNDWILQEYGQLKPDRELMEEWKAKYEGTDADPPEWTVGLWRTSKCVRSELETGIRWDEPTFTAIGVDKSSTGSHYDVVEEDDPIGKKSFRSKALKDKAWDVHQELRSQLNPGGWRMLTATRHADDDVPGRILDHPDMAADWATEIHTVWAGGPRLTKEDFKRVQGGEYECLRPINEVEIFWHGFGQLEEDAMAGRRRFEGDERKKKALSEIAKKMYGLDARTFANQYENIITAQSEQIFFEEWFKNFSPSELGNARTNGYILTDSATGRDYRSSYRVVALVEVSPDLRRYVVDLDFGRWDPEGYVGTILDYWERFAPRGILMEKVAWQESFKTNIELMCKIRGIKPPRVIDVPGRTAVNKLERIEGLQPVIRNQEMLFSRHLLNKESEGGPVWKTMIEQFKRVHELEYVKELLLDIPDALSDALVLDKEGQLICRPPRRQTKALPEGRGISPEHVMAPLRDRIRETRPGKAPAGKFWERPQKGKKSMWDR